MRGNQPQPQPLVQILSVSTNRCYGVRIRLVEDGRSRLQSRDVINVFHSQKVSRPSILCYRRGELRRSHSVGFVLLAEFGLLRWRIPTLRPPFWASTRSRRPFMMSGEKSHRADSEKKIPWTHPSSFVGSVRRVDGVICEPAKSK